MEELFGEVQDTTPLTSDYLLWLAKPLFAVNVFGQRTNVFSSYLLYPRHETNIEFPTGLCGKGYKHVRKEMTRDLFNQLFPDDLEKAATITEQFFKLLKDGKRRWADEVNSMVQAFNTLQEGNGDAAGVREVFTDGMGKTHAMMQQSSSSMLTGVEGTESDASQDSDGVELLSVSAPKAPTLLPLREIEHNGEQVKIVGQTDSLGAQAGHCLLNALVNLVRGKRRGPYRAPPRTERPHTPFLRSLRFTSAAETASRFASPNSFVTSARLRSRG